MERHRVRLLAGTCLAWLVLTAGVRADWINSKVREDWGPGFPCVLYDETTGEEEQESVEPKPEYPTEEEWSEQVWPEKPVDESDGTTTIPIRDKVDTSTPIDEVYTMTPGPEAPGSDTLTNTTTTSETVQRGPLAAMTAPEPSSLVLLGVGMMVSVGVVARRRR